MKTLLISLAALAIAAPVASAPARHQAATVHHAAPVHDWSRVVAATPAYGYRMGNPNAPVKLVEYGSLSCPHCAAFEAHAPTLIANYVRSGRVSWEFRTYLLFPTDPGVSLLIHCAPAASFFRLSAQLYATQATWMGRLRALPPAELTRLGTLKPSQRILPFIHASGVDAFFRAHGMSDGQIRACLTNKAGLDRLAALTNRGDKEGVNGTPSFFINGVKNEAYDWEALEPLLKQAGG